MGYTTRNMQQEAFWFQKDNSMTDIDMASDINHNEGKH